MSASLSPPASSGEKLRIIVGDAKNLASSRKLYCELVVLDATGAKVTAAQRTLYHSKSSNPTWNQEIEFDAPTWAGFLLTVWERHTFLPDKFLGIVTVRFNNKKYKPGDQILSDWFTLAKRKQKDTVSGAVQITVIFGHKTKSTPKVEKKKPKKDEDEPVDPDNDKRDLRVSSKFAAKGNELKDSAYVVVPEDESEDSDTEKTPKKPKKPTTDRKPSPEKTPDGADSTKTTDTGDAPPPRKGSLREPKKGVDAKKTASTGSAASSASGSGDSIPKTPKGQIELIIKLSKLENSILKDVEQEEYGNNIVFVLYNPSKDTESFVTLMVPDNTRREEYKLFTHDGVIELGNCGSILHAMNKVLKQFAARNRMATWVPKLPLPELEEDEPTPKPGKKTGGRKALMESMISTASEVFDVEDHVVKGDDTMGLETKPMGRDSVQKHADEYKRLHGAAALGTSPSKGGNLLVRLALDGRSFLSELMGDVWDLDLGKRIVVELELSGPYYMDSQAPPKVALYQVPIGADLNNELKDITSFGLGWFLQKRLEKFLPKNWPPTHSHIFLDLISHVIDKTLTCTKGCMICDKKLDFQMLKPSICDNPLCMFSYDQYGLGADLAALLRKEPLVVDLLINFTAASATGDHRRFNPYPFGIEVRTKKDGKEDVKSFSTNGKDKNPSLIIQLLNKLPPVETMKTYPTSAELRTALNAIDTLLYPLLRWIITSNRAHIAELKPSEHLKEFGTSLQFLLLSTPPAKEKKFQEAKQKQGAFWAFHGSGFFNWHAIVRNGLRNLSGTELMSTGAAYGSGIYMATESGTSIGYAGAGAGWVNSSLNVNGKGNGYCENFQCLALCEVISAGYKANPYYVVPNEDHVATRYLFVYNSKNIHKTVQANRVTFPKGGRFDPANLSSILGNG